MMLLPDTHTVIWLLESPGRIPAKTLAKLSNPSERVLLSAIVTWEIGIKVRLGKLKLRVKISEMARVCLEDYGFEPLPVSIAHTLLLDKLPDIHRDPFDRLLIAQALSEKLRIVTGDENIAQYAVSTIW